MDKKEKRQQHEAKRQKREMRETWDSFEYLLREKLAGADNILARIDYEASAVGVSVTVRREFVCKKLIELINEIVDEREGKRDAM
ncbi:hypothetical protein ACFQ3W_25595 [Paenibacillus puldeungensis]|uniref:Uncharacterized protein n=1 Tax=Paenibacillus puldeungensis TaxID=696536 RepID=A0ABW3S655_9BACL